MFSKTFPFWIIKTRYRLVLKLKREVLITSSAKNAFNHRHSLLPLQCFQKNFPFLDRQNSGLFGTQTYAKGIDFLLSKKAMTLICQYGVYDQRLVFNRIERSRKYNKKKRTANCRKIRPSYPKL